MHGGVLKQLGTPEEVYRRPASAFVADFVGASNRLEGTVKGSGDGGSYSVELDCSSRTLAVDGTPGLGEGERVWVVVRPEAAVLGAAPAGGVTGEALVVDVSFLGPQTIYKLQSDQLGALTVTASAHGVQHGPGSTVLVGWPIGSVWAVPMTEANGSAAESPTATPSAGAQRVARPHARAEGTGY
jgi:ABC-type Fe3+/spermidine/putrescine transport system ATPase subunit